MLSSNDEFMMNDWANIYMDKIPGEKHVFVVPNTEHSLGSGILRALGTIGTFLRSVNNPHSLGRPTFDFKLND